MGLISRLYCIGYLRKCVFDYVFEVHEKLLLPIRVTPHFFMDFHRIEASIQPDEEMTV